MNSQLTSNAEALRLFFTDDIYLVPNKNQTAFAEPVSTVQSVTAETVAQPSIPLQYENSAPEKTLVEEPVVVLKREYRFEFLGKNQKGILILVNDKANKVSTTAGTELLRKLVKAIELTNNDFALINYANYIGATYSDLKTFFKCRLVLSFGVASHELGLAEQNHNQWFEVAETRLIFSKNLHELDTDLAGKKMLWSSLQQLKSNA